MLYNTIIEGTIAPLRYFFLPLYECPFAATDNNEHTLSVYISLLVSSKGGGSSASGCYSDDDVGLALRCDVMLIVVFRTGGPVTIG